MKTLFRNVDAVVGREVIRTNIVVEDGTIASIDAPSTSTVDEVVDCTGAAPVAGYRRRPGALSRSRSHTQRRSVHGIVCLCGRRSDKFS